MDQEPGWSEETSRFFINYADYFIPDRLEQIRAISNLIPAPDAPFQVLELACGAGVLANALLERYPNCTVLGLDRSAEMLRAARQRLAVYGERFQAGHFDLAAADWRKPEPVYQAVVSSLAIHHLDDAEKARLYREIYPMLRPGGALLIADILRPAGPLGLKHAADAYDEIVRQQCLASDSGAQAFERFQSEQWNLFRYPNDPVDKPSTLFDQLKWLEVAGFEQVDVFWMRAGHAVFGGYRPAGTA